MVLRKYYPLVVLGLAASFFYLLVQVGLADYYLSVLYTLFFWIALASSWGMLSGYTGYWSFGHAAFYGAGVYTTSILAGKMGVPFLLTIPAAAAVGAALATAIGLVVFRVSKLRGEFFALITLSVTFVVAAIISNTPIDGGAGVILSNVVLPRLARSVSATIYLLGLALALSALLISYGIYHSRFGMGLRAIYGDEDVAEVKGVPTFSYKLMVFALSSAIAAAVGSVQAVYVGYVTVGETFSITIPLYVVLMSILGGARHWLGPAVGAIVIVTALDSVAGTTQAELGKAGVALALIIVILVLPQGLIPYLLRLVRPLNGSQAATEQQPQTSVSSGGSWHAGTDSSGPAGVLLECVDVRKSFGGIQALRGVNLQVYSGEILALVGPNGSGKSTLINTISGHFPVTSGIIILGSQEISQLTPHEVARSGLARTYQIPRIFEDMTVRENVAICAVFGNGKAPQQAREEAGTWLNFTGLADRASVFPKELNLHERKFIELARALATKPKLLLLDEVLCGLNPLEIERAIALIRDIQTKGTTIVFVEHLMRVVVALADRVAVLDQGQLLALGRPLETMRDPRVINAYLGKDYAA
jgi:branched-chain amino acid transport system permease protein